MRRGKQFVVRRLDEYYYDLVRRDGPLHERLCGAVIQEGERAQGELRDERRRTDLTKICWPGSVPAGTLTSVVVKRATWVSRYMRDGMGRLSTTTCPDVLKGGELPRGSAD